MKPFKYLSAAMLSALLLAGCSGQSAPGVSKSVSVSTTCTAEANGMNLKIVLNAPSEDEDITSFDLTVNLPFEAIRNAAGDAGAQLSDAQLKEAMGQAESMYKTILSSALDIDENDIKVKTTDSDMTLSMTLKDFSKFQSLSGIQESNSLVYKDVLASLQNESHVHCD